MTTTAEDRLNRIGGPSPVLKALDQLDHALEVVSAAERPAVIVALSGRLASLGARMVAEVGVPRQPDEPDHWITVAEAAEIARVTTTRIYAWSATKSGRRWASRPTRKTLLINEALFRAWLRVQSFKGGSAQVNQT